MKILIIGSKGFIGSHAYDYFAKNQYDVYGADVSVDYADPRYFTIDSTNSDFSEIFENQRFEVCINCSGAASVPDSLAHSLRDFTLNSSNVFKILDGIKKHNSSCKFINLSSAAVYGNPKSLPIKETDDIMPVSPYGFHKKFAEDILYEFHHFFGLQCCSLRIFSAYGPRLSKQILWDLYQKTKTHTAIQLFGTGRETRDFIHITDILQAIELVVNHGSFSAEAYNIGNGEQITIRQIAELVLGALHFEGDLSFTGVEREGDPLYWVADIAKIKSLGYRKQVSIEEGIKSYLQWARELK